MSLLSQLFKKILLIHLLFLVACVPLPKVSKDKEDLKFERKEDLNQVENIGDIETKLSSRNGEVLYQKACQSCHGDLAFSTKKNRSSQIISRAIQDVRKMNYLKDLLDEGQVNLIAEVLNQKVIDRISPQVTLSTNIFGPTNKAIALLATFNEEVIVFNPSLVKIENGTLINFKRENGRQYKIEVNPLQDGATKVLLRAGAAQDSSGNSSLISNELSFQIDKTSPTAQLSSAAANKVMGSVKVIIKLSEPVPSFNKNLLTVTNSVVDVFLQLTPLSYEASIRPLQAGGFDVHIEKNKIVDSVGNANSIASNKLSYVYDNTQPVLIPTLTSPTDAMKPLNKKFDVELNFSKKIQSLVEGQLQVTNGKLSNFRTSDNQRFFFTVTPIASGMTTVLIPGGVVQDSQGTKNSAASLSRQIDLVAPVVTIDSPLANTKVNKSVTISGQCEDGLPISVSGDIAAITPPSDLCQNKSYQLAVNLSSSDGIKKVQLEQIDEAGNRGLFERSFIRDSNQASKWEMARKVLEQKCISCHRPGGSASFSVIWTNHPKPFSEVKEDDVKKIATIVPGSADQSSLAYRLKGFIGGPNGANKNMPIGLGLEESERDAVVNWINSLDAVAETPSFKKFEGFECQETEQKYPGATQIKRKTKAQLINKTSDFLTILLNSSTAQSIVKNLKGEFDLIPDDNDKEMSVFDVSLSSAHVNAYFKLANKLADEISSSSTRLQGFFNSTCITGSNPSASCIKDAISEVAPFILERIPLDQDFQEYQSVVTESPENGPRDLIVVMFMSIPSLFHVYYENETLTGTSTIPLSQMEIAKKMSFLLWNSIPDRTLVQKALNNELKNPVNLEKEINRMTSDPKFNRGTASFFRNWLHLDKLAPLNTALPSVQTKLGLLRINDPVKLREDLIDEAINLSLWATKTDKNFDQLLKTTRVFRPCRRIGHKGLQCPLLEWRLQSNH